MDNNLIPIETIQNKIIIIRGLKVILDRDLAELYGVKTFVLNQAVKRNSKRFPKDFMFQLNDKELDELITNCDKLENLKYTPSKPYVFTEHGVAMLSSVLHSDRAIFVNIQIMRAFIEMRKMIASNELLMRKIDELESKYDKQFSIVFQTLKQLIETPDKPQKPIGFRVK